MERSESAPFSVAATLEIGFLLRRLQRRELLVERVVEICRQRLTEYRVAKI